MRAVVPLRISYAIATHRHAQPQATATHSHTHLASRPLKYTGNESKPASKYAVCCSLTSFVCGSVKSLSVGKQQASMHCHRATHLTLIVEQHSRLTLQATNSAVCEQPNTMPPSSTKHRTRGNKSGDA